MAVSACGSEVPSTCKSWGAPEKRSFAAGSGSRPHSPSIVEADDTNRRFAHADCGWELSDQLRHVVGRHKFLVHGWIAPQDTGKLLNRTLTKQAYGTFPPLHKLPRDRRGPVLATLHRSGRTGLATRERHPPSRSAGSCWPSVRTSARPIPRRSMVRGGRWRPPVLACPSRPTPTWPRAAPTQSRC